VPFFEYEKVTHFIIDFTGNKNDAIYGGQKVGF
jgi:hypothetical protein